jgi:hypothetical protein
LPILVGPDAALAEGTSVRIDGGRPKPFAADREPRYDWLLATTVAVTLLVTEFILLSGLVPLPVSPPATSAVAAVAGIVLAVMMAQTQKRL